MMKCTLEISMYPLSENYEQIVTDFIVPLKERQEIELEVNGLSTQIFGDYDSVMPLVSQAMKEAFEQHKAIFVLKVAGVELRKEGLPEELK